MRNERRRMKDVSGLVLGIALALFFCLPAWAVTTSSRSVGEKDVFSTGTISVSVDGLTITFTNAITSYFGKGDELVIDTAGTPENRYVLSRDSNTQVTLQTASTKTTQSGLAFTLDESYTSLAVWESGEERDLTLATGSDEIAEAVCYPMKDSGYDGPTAVSGWTTDTAHYIRVYAHPSYTHTGKWVAGTSCYTVVSGAATDHCIAINESHTRIEGVQLQYTYNQHWGGAIEISHSHGQLVNGGDIRIHKVLSEGQNSSDWDRRAVAFTWTANPTVTATITDCVFYDFGSRNCEGVLVYRSGYDIYVYNTTVENSTYGFRMVMDIGSNMTVKNCIVSNVTDGFYGNKYTDDTDYNTCTNEDTDHPGENLFVGNPTYENRSGKDFHLSSGDTLAKNKGTTDTSGLPLDVTLTDDIDGDTLTGLLAYDIGADQVTSVTNVTSTTANGSYDEAETITITIAFNDSVTVTGTPQLELETGSADRQADYSSGSGTTTLTFQYTVSADDSSSDLDYTGTGALTLNGGTMVDSHGYNVDLTLPSPGASGSLGANKAIVIDTGGPTVSSVSSAEPNDTYSIVGEVLDITVTFTEAVTVTGTPHLELETGEVDRYANYSSGSGTTALTFQYTVQTKDITGDLDYTGTGALALNSGTIKDAAGNNATLTLASPGAANSLGANKAIVIAAPSAKVMADFVYDADEDEINIVMYLEEQGRQVASGSTNTLRTGSISIYGSSDASTAMYTGSSSSADANGNYWFTISDAVSTYSFALGKKYYASLSIVYGTASDNVTYRSAASFDLGVSKRMKQIHATAQSVSTTVAAQADTISSAVIADVGADVTSIQTDTTSIKTAVGTTPLATQIATVSSDLAAVEYNVASEILNRETLIKMGESLSVAYRTASGLGPTVTVYDADGTKVIDGAAMTEMGTTGIYTYDLTMLDAWGTGDFTVVCSESTRGTTDAMILSSVNYDLQDVAQSASTVLGQISRQTTLTEAAENISTKFSGIESVLARLNTNLTVQNQVTSDSGADMEFIYAKLNEISAAVKELGVSGPSLEKIYTVSEDKKYNIDYLKNKTEQLKAMVDLSKKMIENAANKPITQVWFEFR